MTRIIEDFAPMLYTVCVAGKIVCVIDMQDWSLAAQCSQPVADGPRQRVLSFYHHDETGEGLIEVIDRDPGAVPYDCTALMVDKRLRFEAVHAARLSAVECMSPAVGQHILRACLAAQLSPLTAAEVCQKLGAW